MRPATADYDARWGYRQLDARRFERRRYGGAIRRLNHRPAASRPRVLDTLAGLGRGPLVATVCHPYTLKSLVRALRRAFGGRAKRSPRLTRRMLAGEVAAAGLELGRVIRVMPLLSEVWVVVVRKPGSTS